MGVVSKRHGHPHEEYFGRDYIPPGGGGGGHLELPPRAHSRMSAPEPLPIPFQKSFLPKSILTHAPSSNEPSPTGTPPPILTPTKSPGVDSTHSQENSPHSARGSRRRSNPGMSGASLKPVVRKSMSASVDMMNMDHYHSGASWKGKG